MGRPDHPGRGKKPKMKEWRMAARPAEGVEPGECSFRRSTMAAAERDVVTIDAAAGLNQGLVSQCLLVTLRDSPTKNQKKGTEGEAAGRR